MLRTYLFLTKLFQSRQGLKTFSELKNLTQSILVIGILINYAFFLRNKQLPQQKKVGVSYNDNCAIPCGCKSVLMLARWMAHMREKSVILAWQICFFGIPTSFYHSTIRDKVQREISTRVEDYLINRS